MLLFVDLFVLLTAYYCCKVVREPLILVGGGAEVKSYSAGAMALLLIVFVPIYGRAASRARRDTLLGGLTIFFISSLIAFWALGRAGVSVGVAFFLWVGVFNLIAVSQLWALANDVCAPGQGRRVFPFIALGGTAGAIVGAEGAGASSASSAPIRSCSSPRASSRSRRGSASWCRGSTSRPGRDACTAVSRSRCAAPSTSSFAIAICS